MFAWLVVASLPSLPGIEIPHIEQSGGWLLSVSAIFVPIMVVYRKFLVIEEGSLATTPIQEREMAKYAHERRKRKNLAKVMIVIAMGMWGMDAFLLGSNLNEMAIVLLFVVAMAGLALLVTTRCPYCKSITIINAGNSSGRCMNCHRDIDVD
jgi:hypothetical protein